MRFGDTVERFEGAGAVERVVTRPAVVDSRRDLVVVGVGTEPERRGAAAATGVADERRDRGRVRRWRPRSPGSSPPATSRRHDASGLRTGAGRALRQRDQDGASTRRARMLGSTDALRRPALVLVGPVGRPDPDGRRVRPTGEMVVRGSLEDRSFCAFFLDGAGVLRAVVSIDWAGDVRRSLQTGPARRSGPTRRRSPTPTSTCGRSRDDAEPGPAGACGGRCYAEGSDAPRS